MSIPIDISHLLKKLIHISMIAIPIEIYHSDKEMSNRKSEMGRHNLVSLGNTHGKKRAQ